MKLNAYLAGVDVLGQLPTTPSQAQANPFYAAQATLATQRLAAVNAALLAARQNQVAQATALAAKYQAAGQTPPAAVTAAAAGATSSDASAAQPEMSDYMRGVYALAGKTPAASDVVGLVPMKALTSSVRKPVLTATASSTLKQIAAPMKPISASGGLKMLQPMPSSGGTVLKAGLLTPTTPPIYTTPPVLKTSGLMQFDAALAAARAAEQAALAQYASTMQLPSSVFTSLKAADPTFTLPAGWSVSVGPPAPANGATTATPAVPGTPGSYQWPTTGLPATAVNPNNPTLLMNGSPNPNPPNPNMPGYLMNGQVNPYAPNPSNPSVTMSGVANPNPPNPAMPGYLMSGAIDPYYQQEMAAGGIVNPNAPYGASSYGSDPYGGGAAASPYGGDSGGGYGDDGGDSGGVDPDAGVDWGDGTAPDYGDGSGGYDDQSYGGGFDPSQTPFAMATGFSGGSGGGYGGDGSGGGNQYVDPSSFGGDQQFAQDAEAAAEQEASDENVDWGDGSSSSDSVVGQQIIGEWLSIVGAYNIASEQDKFNAQGPLSVQAAQAVLRAGLAAINNAISIANAKNLPGPTERLNVLGKLNWHASAIGKLTATPNLVYPSWSDLEKWTMAAFVDSDAVDDGSAAIDGAKELMWNDIATAQSARQLAGEAYDSASAALQEPLREAKTAAIWTGLIVAGVVGVVGYGVYKVAMGPVGQQALGTYIGRRYS